MICADRITTLSAYAAAKILQEAVANVEIQPADFDSQYDLKRGIVGNDTLASLGALGGASVGIAMFGTAFSGGWVFAPASGLLAFSRVNQRKVRIAARL